MRDSLDCRYWLTWGAAKLRRAPDAGETETVADALGVSARTVRHWRAENRAPEWALRALMMATNGVAPWVSDAWPGWRFASEAGELMLYAPDGSRGWSQGDLLRHRDQMSRLRSIEATLQPGAQLAWLAPGSGRRTLWPGGEVPTWAQLEEALRAVVSDVVRRGNLVS